ncbi:MAG: hypothetical protein K2O91_02185, partial [Lachnospiraceae bacterium]|nr:hypothetical protein [Lachnospiraceae bacterium]
MKIIYSKEMLTYEFKELCLGMLQDDEDILRILNAELSTQHETFHPDYGSICKERPLISYYRSITITDMELEESDPDCLALDITNRIRTKVRKSLMKSYSLNFAIWSRVKMWSPCKIPYTLDFCI